MYSLTGTGIRGPGTRPISAVVATDVSGLGSQALRSGLGNEKIIRWFLMDKRNLVRAISRCYGHQGLSYRFYKVHPDFQSRDRGEDQHPRSHRMALHRVETDIIRPGLSSLSRNG